MAESHENPGQRGAGLQLPATSSALRNHHFEQGLPDLPSWAAAAFFWTKIPPFEVVWRAGSHVACEQHVMSGMYAVNSSETGGLLLHRRGAESVISRAATV